MRREVCYLTLFFVASIMNFPLSAADQPPPEALYRVNADGTGLALLRADPEKAYWGPAWSPDGIKIAISILDVGGTGGELYLLDADGSSATPLTQNGRGNYFPAWSPNGEAIAFISQQGEVNTAEIYTIHVDGTEETRLTENDAWEAGMSWSPDGQEIAFGSERGGNWQIYSMNADGSNQRPLATPAHGNVPTWSPNGQQIAFTSNRDGDDDIYIAQSDGSSQQNITNNTAWDDNPAWSPDGSRIAFVSDRDGMARVYTVDIDGGNIVNLTRNLDLVAGFPTWSPDSEQILFMARELTDEERSNNTPIIVPIVSVTMILVAGLFVINRRRTVHQ